ncbi:hypothetical protein THIX_50098 [Thiomonas sp. X19]|nr:hypothetical protein THIX_50098 [Thiomonas sp. X19]
MSKTVFVRDFWTVLMRSAVLAYPSTSVRRPQVERTLTSMLKRHGTMAFLRP